jgi:hypothetical protein
MTAPDSKPPVIYRLRLRVLNPDENDGVRRLRQALKLLLRKFGLRCVEIVREQTP